MLVFVGGTIRGLTIGVLYGLQVQFSVFLKAADVSLLFQDFGTMEDVFLRSFVRDHRWDVR